MKVCSDCKKDKELGDFPPYSASKDGLLNRCRDCKRQYDRNHYSKHRLRLAPLKTQRSILVRKRNTNWIKEYLSTHPCVDCGNSNPIVLEFDHLFDKLYNISDMIKGGFKIESIQKEIAKCEVRCANCHRLKTWERSH